jgi:hypothetical protein
MPARGGHRSRPAVLPDTPPGVANKFSELSRHDGPTSLTAVRGPSPDVLQPQQRKRRNTLRHRCNNIAGSALVLKHHRNTGRSP